MIDEVYRNSFKEVYDILKNTEDELLAKVPNKFMDFIKNNMNENYTTGINPNIDIDKQPLLKETEAILSLVYRSYWASNEEKQELNIKNKQEIINNKEKKKEECYVKDIYQIFEERKNINKITIDNQLMVIKKDNYIKRIFKKILRIFRKD
jgi:hypothetical protein